MLPGNQHTFSVNRKSRPTGDHVFFRIFVATDELLATPVTPAVLAPESRTQRIVAHDGHTREVGYLTAAQPQAPHPATAAVALSRGSASRGSVLQAPHPICQVRQLPLQQLNRARAGAAAGGRRRAFQLRISASVGGFRRTPARRRMPRSCPCFGGQHRRHIAVASECCAVAVALFLRLV